MGQISVLSGSVTGSTPGVGTAYAQVESSAGSGFWDSNEINAENVVPCKGIISNFQVQVNTAPGASHSRVYTIMHNGVATSISVTLTSNASGSDTTHTVTVNPGDTISIRCVTSSGSITANRQYWACQFKAFSTNRSLILAGAPLSLPGGVTRYLPIQGSGAVQSAGFYYAAGICAATGTLKNLYVSLSAAPGSGQSVTFYLYRNNANTGISVTISGTNTTGSDTVDTSSVNAGDDLAYVVVTSSGAAAFTYALGVEFDPDTDGYSLGFQSSVNMAQNDTEYNNCAGGDATNSTVALEETLTVACTAKNLYQTSTLLASGQTYTVFNIQNGSSGSLKAQATGNGSSYQKVSDTTHTISYANGDLIGLELQTSSTTGTLVNCRAGLVFYIATPLIATPTLSATEGNSPSFIKQVNNFFLSLTEASTAAFVKMAEKILTVTSSSTSAFGSMLINCIRSVGESTTASFQKFINSTMATALASSLATVLKLIYIPLTAIEGNAVSIMKMAEKILSAIASSVASFGNNFINKYLTVAESSIVSFAKVVHTTLSTIMEAAAPEIDRAILKMLSTVSSSTASFTNQVNKYLTVMEGNAVSFQNLISKILFVAEGYALSMVKFISTTFSTILESNSVSLVKQVVTTLSTTEANLATMTKTVGHIMTALSSTAESFVKLVGKFLSVTDSPIASFTNLISTTMSAVSSSVASIVKQVNKYLTAAGENTVAMIKTASVNMQTLLASAPTMEFLSAHAVLLVALSGFAAGAVSIQKAISKTMSFVSNSLASISNIRQLYRTFSTTASSLARVIKDVLKNVTATAESLASSVSMFRKIYIMLATAESNTDEIIKLVNKTMRASSSSVSSIVKFISKTMTAVASSLASLTTTRFFTLTATVSALATLIRTRLKTIVATCSSIPSILSTVIFKFINFVVGFFQDADQDDDGEFEVSFNNEIDIDITLSKDRG